MKRTKTEMKRIAKDLLTETVGIAYYHIADSNEYTEDEKDIIIDYVHKYGTAMCKAIKESYTVY